MESEGHSRAVPLSSCSRRTHHVLPHVCDLPLAGDKLVSGPSDPFVLLEVFLKAACHRLALLVPSGGVFLEVVRPGGLPPSTLRQGAQAVTVYAGGQSACAGTVLHWPFNVKDPTLAIAQSI